MKNLISQAFTQAKNQRRPALITYTVAGDNTKKKFTGNTKFYFKTS